jgi:hypothetical protein
MGGGFFIGDAAILKGGLLVPFGVLDRDDGSSPSISTDCITPDGTASMGSAATESDIRRDTTVLKKRKYITKYMVQSQYSHAMITATCTINIYNLIFFQLTFGQQRRLMNQPDS